MDRYLPFLDLPLPLLVLLSCTEPVHFDSAAEIENGLIVDMDLQSSKGGQASLESLAEREHLSDVGTLKNWMSLLDGFVFGGVGE